MEGLENIRIEISHPKTYESWQKEKFSLYSHHDVEGFVVLAYKMDLNDKTTRYKCIEYLQNKDLFLQSMLKDMTCFDQAEEFLKIEDPDKQTIETLFSKISENMDQNLDEHIQYVLNTKTEDIRREVMGWSCDLMEALRISAMKDKPSIKETQTGTFFYTEIIPKAEKSYNLLNIYGLKDIPPNQMDEHRWKLEIADNAKVMQLEKLEERKDAIVFVYRPVIDYEMTVPA